jgi:hypothetical protein
VKPFSNDLLKNKSKIEAKKNGEKEMKNIKEMWRRPVAQFFLHFPI